MPLSKETFGGSSLHSNVVLSAKQGGIDPIKDERNKITIPQGLHKSMHTTKYYEYVTKKSHLVLKPEKVSKKSTT